MLLTGFSSLALLFRSLPVSLTIFLSLFQVHQKQFWLLSSSCFIVFFKNLFCKVLVFISIFAFFWFYSVVCRDYKVPYSASFLFFCWLSLGLVVWPRLGDLFVSRNPRELCAFHSWGRIPSFAYTTCSYGQISISSKIPCWLLSLPSRV